MCFVVNNCKMKCIDGKAQIKYFFLNQFIIILNDFSVDYWTTCKSCQMQIKALQELALQTLKSLCRDSTAIQISDSPVKLSSGLILDLKMTHAVSMLQIQPHLVNYTFTLS